VGKGDLSGFGFEHCFCLHLRFNPIAQGQAITCLVAFDHTNTY